MKFDFDKLLGPEGELRATTVVNLKTEPYDVYVGRPGKGMDGYFGNPISRNNPCLHCGKIHRFRYETIKCFGSYARRRVLEDKTYRDRVSALYGKRLGCFCKPNACHADTLADLAEELHNGLK